MWGFFNARRLFSPCVSAGTATSHISGEKVNRFTPIHQNTGDLVKKTKMGRLLGAHTGCRFQRCVGMDALNALSIVTYDIDQAKGTSYYSRFLKYLSYVQEKDLVCDGAMTDPKGDRSLPPHRRSSMRLRWEPECFGSKYHTCLIIQEHFFYSGQIIIVTGIVRFVLFFSSRILFLTTKVNKKWNMAKILKRRK